MEPIGMASRVLLISINTYMTPDPVFPLGMAHLASALRAAGHKVFWQDNLAGPKPIEQVIEASSPDCIGISIRNIDDVLIRKKETFFNILPELCSRIRAVTRAPILLGGSGFSIFPRELIEVSTANFGVRGEGEEALLSFIKALEEKTDASGIPGLVHRGRNGIECNPLTPALSREERELVHRGLYEGRLGELPEGAASFYLQNGGMLNVQTQRGCPHGCCYCTYPVIEGRHSRRKSGEQVADEFESAIRAGAKYLFIVDSTFNSSLAHVHDVCEALFNRKLKTPWGCFLRPQGLDAATMKLMARSGLAHAEFGSDSFSDAVLEESGKGFTFEDIRHSSRLAREAGIDYCHFLISGGPGETKETMCQGFDRSRELEGAVIMAVVGMRIYPGTPLFERAVREKRIAPDQNLLEPQYYVSPSLSADETFSMLQDFAARAPNWIVGDTTPAYAGLVARLRSRGIVGPLWGYLSMMRRLMPENLAAPAGHTFAN